MVERDERNPDAEAPRLRREWTALQIERRILEAETAAVEASRDPETIQDHRARLYAHNCRLYALWEDLERFHMMRGSIAAFVPQDDD